MRIVSLLPSATEIVYALGIGDQLVGVSHDCDYPPKVREKPVLSRAIVTPELPSPQIDRIVRQNIHRGLSVYHLDAEQLKALNPDLILTQELCEVCAPTYTEVLQAVKILTAKPTIVSLEPATLSDILENILQVGKLTCTEERARQLVTELRRRIDHVAARTRDLQDRPEVACIEWLEPLYAAGHWVPEMVELAGGRDCLGKAGKPSYATDWSKILRCAPKLIVLMPCGFSPERTRREIHLLSTRPGWEGLSAVQNRQVFIVHGSDYFNRPGPRIVTGLEILAKLIHPEVFSDLQVPEGSYYRL